MKNVIIPVVLFVLVACGSEDKTDTTAADTAIVAGAHSSNSKFTTIQWLDSSQNLGKMAEGQKVNITFRFRNTGNSPLVIQSVTPGCGCTVADYPREPIAPGKEGEITGAFDSKGREGLQHKQISVVANTEGTPNHQVEFMVEVVKAKQ